MNSKFATDSLYFKKKTLVSNIETQVFSHKCGFNHVSHLSKVNGEQVGHALAEFVQDYGAPEHLTFDGSQVQKGRNTLFMKNIRRAGFKHHISVPYRPNQNPAEGPIRELKREWYWIQAKTGAHERLSDFGIKYALEIENVTHNTSRYAYGRTPLEVITGLTPDITEHLDFGFYDWVLFKPNGGTAPAELGCWLGVLHKVGQLMTYWILPRSGRPISEGTVQRLRLLEKQTDEWKMKMKKFMAKVDEKLKAGSLDIPATRYDENKLLSLENK